MKRVLLIAAVVLVTLIVVVVAIGAMLPKAHTATRTVRIARPPGDVFDALTDWRTFPEWRDGVQAVCELPGKPGEPARNGWVEVGRHGELPLEVVESDRPRKLVTRIADP